MISSFSGYFLFIVKWCHYAIKSLHFMSCEDGTFSVTMRHMLTDESVFLRFNALKPLSLNTSQKYNRTLAYHLRMEGGQVFSCSGVYGWEVVKYFPAVGYMEFHRLVGRGKFVRIVTKREGGRRGGSRGRGATYLWCYTDYKHIISNFPMLTRFY